MEISTELLMAIGTGFVAIMSAIGGALWKALRESEKRTQEKLTECETKHEQANVQLLDITKTVGELKGAGDIATMVSTALTDMHRDMMEEIRRTRDGS